MEKFRSRSTPLRPVITVIMLACLSAIGLSGCATPKGGGGSGTPPTPPTPPPPDPNYKLMTGNWVLTAATSTSKAAPFMALGGFINEQPGDLSINDFTTAALQATSGSCFTDPPNLSLTGGAQGHALGLTSFASNGQVVTITATKNEAATQLTGNYTITGGCADGAAGTLAGSLYEPLTGTYSGPVGSASPAESIKLVSAQSPQGDGDGKSYLSGTATFENISCFSSGTIVETSSYVLGSLVAMTITTNETKGSQVVATGSFDAAADVINFSSVEIVKGSCAGTLGAATLNLAK